MIDDEKLQDFDELEEDEAVEFVERELEQLRAKRRPYVQPETKLRRMDPKLAWKKANGWI